MSSSPLAIVVLAAGKGTRMKSDQPKVMHTLAGKPMIKWLLGTCEGLNPEKIIVVVGPDMPELESACTPHETAVQKDRLGTADAVKAALPALKGFNGKVLIVMGDEPLVPVQVLGDLAAYDGLAALAFTADDPSGMGRVILGKDNHLKEIVEDRDCTPAQKQITLCNAGTYCVPSENLAAWIDQIGNDNAQKEFYLTDLPTIAAQDGMHTKISTFPWHGSWGVNDRVQLAEHEKLLQQMLRHDALLNGVHMDDPDTVYFHHDTKIAAGVSLEPNVFFGPGVCVEDGVTIKAFSHLEGTHIKSGAIIGPFARLRPGADIGENVKVGNFVEVKKSTIGAGSKINHLSYVGDCDMGEGVNFSAGAITVNYDGYDKHKTIIGDGTIVGCNVNLVAPVNVGQGAFLAAGSTLTKDIPADALAIARDKQSVKKRWAEKYRKQKENR